EAVDFLVPGSAAAVRRALAAPRCDQLRRVRFRQASQRQRCGRAGPMQFMPATWRAYGLGGDVHHPRDAIFGAANYLAANGGARNEARALYHYNPSTLYVDAVRRYARRITRARWAFYRYYAWQVFVRT